VYLGRGIPYTKLTSNPLISNVRSQPNSVLAISMELAVRSRPFLFFRYRAKECRKMSEFFLVPVNTSVARRRCSLGKFQSLASGPNMPFRPMTPVYRLEQFRQPNMPPEKTLLKLEARLALKLFSR
jgi:hypothetical protein